MEQLSERFFDGIERYRSFHDAQTEDLNFSLKMMHYGMDRQRDLAGMGPVQVYGNELLQTLVHLVSQVSRAPIKFDFRPNDRNGDAMTAEIFRRFAEQTLFDPSLQFESLRDVVVMSALAARMWGMEISFEPHLGAHGRIVLDDRDGRSIIWAARYHSPHHLLCPWVMTFDHVHIDEVMARDDWDDIKDLRPDGEVNLATAREGARAGQPWGGVPFLKGTKDTVVIARIWEREFRSTKKRTRMFVLPADDRFMQCQACLARSNTQEQIGKRLPERSREPCPECGSRRVERIDRVDQTDEVVTMPRFRHTWFSPYQGKIHGRTTQRIRTPPIAIHRPRDFPGEPMGSSITSEKFSMQSALDHSINLAMQHMENAVPRILTPDQGLKDADGNDAYWGREQGLVYFKTADYPPDGVDIVQPKGVPSDWPRVHQELVAKFLRDRGTNDFSLPEERTRDIAVGTIEAFERIQELPVQWFIERVQREEAHAIVGNMVDLMREHYSDDRAVELMGPEGLFMIQQLRGSDMPNVNVLVTGSRTMSELKIDDMKAMIFLASQPPWLQDVIADGGNIPQSLIQSMRRRKLEEERRTGQPAAPGILDDTGQTNGNVPPAIASRLPGGV